MCFMGLKNQVNTLGSALLSVLFASPCVMMAFFLSDDPLLIERPPGKSIKPHHFSNSSNTGAFKERKNDHSVKQLDMVIFCADPPISPSAVLLYLLPQLLRPAKEQSL